MSASLPRISVLLSCFNAERWLSSSIPSVLNQAGADFELLIVDDGSRDNTLALLRDYASRDSRIVVLAKPNTGLADSLNHGLRQARGEWIARIDADDLHLPGKLEAQLDYVERHPQVVFVGTAFHEITESGVAVRDIIYPDDHAALLAGLLGPGRFPPHASAFYRRQLALELGAYRGRMKRAEDWDLWLRMSDHGKLACLPAPLTSIRKHPSQISNDAAGKRQAFDARMAVVAYWIRRLGQPDPVDADAARFQQFESWLWQELGSQGLFARIELLGAAKQAAQGGRGAMLGALLRHPLTAFDLLQARRRESDWLRALAKRWVQSHPAQPSTHNARHASSH